MQKKEEIIKALKKIAESNESLFDYGNGFEEAINKAIDSIELIYEKEEEKKIPTNLTIYKKAHDFDFIDFCKWMNFKLGDLR